MVVLQGGSFLILGLWASGLATRHQFGGPSMPLHELQAAAYHLAFPTDLSFFSYLLPPSHLEFCLSKAHSLLYPSHLCITYLFNIVVPPLKQGWCQMSSFSFYIYPQIDIRVDSVCAHFGSRVGPACYSRESESRVIWEIHNRNYSLFSVTVIWSWSTLPMQLFTYVFWDVIIKLIP